ncbi:MAG: outer membrane protein assembly factor BamA [Deltaproteobacteria bacterium]|nr:outer membrane protein assembly factor BamA [Deltaproteobacteria bacterium]MBW2139810.1 outer membrane protein assembly factor BamA [Deltaproteobacteria bacterium]MBW2322714.1 outer membrane protein assembly factor BamA [Deltaproteobacteria bacterium]
MLKRIALLLILLMVLPGLARAAETVKVGVLPFTVYGKEDLNYLRKGIQEMLTGQFLDHGVETATKADIRQALGARELVEVSEQIARKFGKALNVDYIIYGSLTKIGRSISLDARIVDTLGLKRTGSVFVQGEGLENLAALIKDLAVKATFKITGRQKLSKIIISGNKRIESDAIKTVLKSKEGDIFSKTKISDDLKSIYRMNYFEDVKVEVEDSEEGKIVHFTVDEKPSIRQIEFVGVRRVEEKDLREVLGYSLYSIQDTKKIVDSVENIKEVYREKGYYNAEVIYKIENIGPKMVGIRYGIKERGRVYIKRIDFKGNENVNRKKLLDLMETKEKGFFTWLTDAGILKRDDLKEDISKILTYYYNHGYIKVQVADPFVEVEEDEMVVTIQINEGPQYKVGKVSFTGDLIEPEEKLFSLIEIDKQAFFNREIIRKDMTEINSLYSSHGYAFALVSPLIREHEDTLSVDITYKITKNQLVYIERIEITGNTKTRDKVIRRQFKINEGDLFSKEKLKKSAMNLNRLGYFKDIKFSQTKGSADNKQNVKIKVEEQPTGAFSIGAGYSSYNKVFGIFSVSQNNLFGKGQKLVLEGSVGDKITEYSMSFTEPWLFDIPLSAGISIYDRTQKYTDYDKDAIGGIIGLGYPIMEYVGLSGRYKYEDAVIENIDEDASVTLETMEGRWKTSSITVALRRDTRNRFFNPSSGSDNSITVEYAGGFLGGTSYFNKYVLNSGWFFPLPWGEHVFFARGKFGFLEGRAGGKVPIFENFVLGGMNSLRGFKWGSIGPLDPATNTVLGGEKMVLFNFEYIFPLIKDAGLMGVVFFDTGNAYRSDENIDFSSLRKSAGAGIRFFSPLGPLRLEWGYVLDPKPGEQTSSWEFSIGSFF